MKLSIGFSILIATFLVVECSHTFMGTNVFRQQAYHRNARYSSYLFQKRIEYINYTLPSSYGYGRSIQGILAFDLTKSKASANVTSGGLGYKHVTIRMKSERGRELHYDINIYV